MNSIESYLEHYFNISERIEYFKNGKQFSAEIEITNRCNLTCRYCYVQAVNEKGISLKKDFIRNLINDLHSYGIREIGWIGGEPLLYKDLAKLMRYTSSKNIKNVLYTNGVLIDEENVIWISKECKNGRIIIHLDSTKYKNFAKGQLKPKQKNHSKIMNSFDLLIKAGYPPEKIILAIPLSKACNQTAEETMQFVADKGIKFINLIPLTSLGRSEQYGEFISKEEMKETFEKRSEILKKPWLNKLGICEYCKQFQLTDFAVSYNGNIYPYIDDFRSQGNVLKGDNIIDILNRYANTMKLSEWVSKDTLRNKMNPNCGNCEFEKYCFGNPVSREKFYIGEPDHDCWLNE